MALVLTAPIKPILEHHPTHCVGALLYQSALEGSTQAAIWWTKKRMKGSGKPQIEHSGDAVLTIQNIYVLPLIIRSRLKSTP